MKVKKKTGRKVGRPTLGQPVSVVFKPETLAWLDSEAKDRGIYRSEMIRMIVEKAETSFLTY